jgi:hypothetical protein
MRLAPCLAFLSSLAASTAAATPAPLDGVTPPAALELGTGVVQNRHLSVRCAAPDACRLMLDFDVVATSATEIHVYGADNVVEIDGRAVRERRLAAGESAHVHIEAERDLRPRYHDDNPFFMMADALWARHVVLGQRSTRLTTARYDAAGLRWEPFYGAAISGPIVVDAAMGAQTRLSIDGREITGSVELADGRAIDLSMQAPSSPSHEWVRSGGPVLALGAYLGPEETRFAARLGYELGITDWMIVSGAIESDFMRQATLSLMLEGATPNMLFFIVLGVVSVSAGIGAVLELSPDGARGAVRFVSSIQAAPAGVQITADYYPEGDEVILSVMGRVSI